MFCSKCGSQVADDARFCHNCGAPIEIDKKTSKSGGKIASKTEDDAKYDIVLIDVTDDEDLSEKAHMAIAYLLFEDEIKKVLESSDPNPGEKRHVKDEAIRKSYNISKDLPVTLKKSIRKKEAIFFMERLEMYGVTVVVGYCPDCGGELDDLSNLCVICGQEAVALIGEGSGATVTEKDVESLLGTTNVYCLNCSTLSQGDAAFCRRCGSRTGPQAFNAQY